MDAARYATPYKLGRPVLAGSGITDRFDSHAVDCPFVFRHAGEYRMMFVGFDGKGYQTGLAASADLIHWEKRGIILPREAHVGWDRVGAAGTWILIEDDLWGIPEPKKVDGKYWMAYHSYPGEGYEEGPAQIGLAWSDDEDLARWNRLPEPVFSWKDGAEWDRGGLYKCCIVERSGTFYMFYNAKNRSDSGWTEQTGVALSEDLRRWHRHAGNPVIRVGEGWDSRFCSDPCVRSDGGKWVMFFFGFDGRHAQDGIALSTDLLSWEKHPDPILPHGAPGDLDEKYAHKPSVVCRDGVLYHFYCACRKHREGDPARNLWDEFRCISVATSRPLA